MLDGEVYVNMPVIPGLSVCTARFCLVLLFCGSCKYGHVLLIDVISELACGVDLRC